MELAENDERSALHFAVLDRSSEMVRPADAQRRQRAKGVYPHRDATAALTIATERGYDEIVAIITDEERRRTGHSRLPDASTMPAQHRDSQRRGRRCGAARRRRLAPRPSRRRIAGERDHRFRWSPDRCGRERQTGAARAAAGSGVRSERAEAPRRHRSGGGSAGFPLWRCAALGREAMAELLLKRGANPNVHVYASGSPVKSAYRHRQPRMIALFTRYGGRSSAPHRPGCRETVVAVGCLKTRRADRCRTGRFRRDGRWPKTARLRIVRRRCRDRQDGAWTDRLAARKQAMVLDARPAARDRRERRLASRMLSAGAAAIGAPHDRPLRSHDAARGRGTAQSDDQRRGAIVRGTPSRRWSTDGHPGRPAEKHAARLGLPLGHVENRATPARARRGPRRTRRRRMGDAARVGGKEGPSRCARDPAV